MASELATFRYDEPFVRKSITFKVSFKVNFVFRECEQKLKIASFFGVNLLVPNLI